MNRLNIEKQTQIVSALVEGNSMRATARMAGVSINTVVKLLIEVGTACREYQDQVFHDLDCRRIQCDEIWSFCYAKKMNVTKKIKKANPNAGDAWTWVALDADTKLVPSWMVGNRDARTGKMFMEDLAKRLKNRVQLSTDGFKAYLQAVENAFGNDIDYGMLIKIYGTPAEKEPRYSPVECIGTIEETVVGRPDPAHLSTSFVERQNLNMRMSMRRFTRLTNAFSKKIENLEHAVALHFMYYNFCRIHKSLRCTPAMKAGVSKRLWEISDILHLI